MLYYIRQEISLKYCTLYHNNKAELIPNQLIFLLVVQLGKISINCIFTVQQNQFTVYSIKDSSVISNLFQMLYYICQEISLKNCTLYRNNKAELIPNQLIFLLVVQLGKISINCIFTVQQNQFTVYSIKDSSVISNLFSILYCFFYSATGPVVPEFIQNLSAGR